MLTEPSLAVLIDCWDNPVNLSLHKSIVEHLENNPAITTVVLASYNCTAEYLKNDTLWYCNSRVLYDSETTPRKIKDLSYVHRLHHMTRDKQHKHERTCPTMLNYHNPSKFQIAMHWPWQLEYYLSQNPHIKNVYVFGSAWDICVAIRPLGYKALTEIQGIRILTHEQCVTSDDLQHPNLDLDTMWIRVGDGTYCYKQA